MANAPTPRQFTVNPANANRPPLLLGLMGPPGGGKTKSALRLADGITRVRRQLLGTSAKPLVIDTETGRALRYHISHGGAHDFDYIQFTPPFVPAHFMDAIKQGVAMGASCIIVDSMSDEHEGEGGVLDWHDAIVPSMGGNEWAAWSKPKASRRVLIAGIQQISVPVILTFRAREKTITKPVMRNGRTKDTPVNIGFQPIAPMEIVHTLDLTCLLPPRANGVPVWNSPKEGEDFVIKLPEFLAPLIDRGAALDEMLGERLAHWQAGTRPSGNGGGEATKRTPEQMTDAYVAKVNATKTLTEYQVVQANDATLAWVRKMATEHPALHDRIVTAQTTKFAALTAAAEPTTDDDDDQAAAGDDDRGAALDAQVDDDELPPAPGGLFGEDDQ